MVVVGRVVGRVVDVGRLTVRCCEVMVGSTGVLLEWSVDRRDCTEEGDGDCLYVLQIGRAHV